MFCEFDVKIDGAHIFNFHHLEDVINGDIAICVFSQYVTLIVEDGVFFDRCSAFYARQFGFFAAIGAAAVIIIVVIDNAIVVIRCNSVAYNAETISIMPW